MTVFQICTLEGWSNLLYNYSQCSDHKIMVVIFFILLVAIGSFFTLNLILAQIIDSYMN